MTPPKILLLENVHPVADGLLQAEGLEVKRIDGSLKEAELIRALDGVSYLGIRSKTQVTAAVLESARSLQAVGAFCIGTNQIALDAAKKQGVAVFNAPFSNTRSVAELVMAEVVALSRHLCDRVMEMHRGDWKKIATGSHEVRGKTLGIVGYGHIGSQMGVLAEFFGMRVCFYDVTAKLPMSNNQSLPTLDALLEVSDFVTLHVPETPQTMGLIGAEQLAKMKKGACLINYSRGTVVDLEALAAVIKSGHLGGAAIDVFPEEPESNTAKGFVSPLQGLPNVILTPHVGGSTLEAQEAIGREVSHAMTRFARTGATTRSVNFPHVELAPTPGTFRVVHVHRNVPGVLRDVNTIVSELEANIQAQTLSTTPEIGYLILDMSRPVAGEVVKRLEALDTTIRARAL